MSLGKTDLKENSNVVDKIMADDAEIIARNISATNGIMHVVNKVSHLTKLI